MNHSHSLNHRNKYTDKKYFIGLGSKMKPVY